MKPWNIAAASAGVLVSNLYRAEGHMIPGFCPRYPKMSLR